MTSSVKTGLTFILLKLPFLKRISLYLTRNTPRVLLYHRFIESEEKGSGITKNAFEQQLSILKKEFTVLSFCDYIQAVNSGMSFRKPIAVITVDDGYYDFYEIAYPLLKQYQLPATLFITTKFVDKEMWFWWDKIRYILVHGAAKECFFEYRDKGFNISVVSNDDIEKSWQFLADYCMRLPEDEKREFLGQLSVAMHVNLPASGPLEFKAVGWDEVAEMHKNGIEIGSHTLTHPILTAIDDNRLEEEVRFSKRVIEDRLHTIVNSFSYPNGKPGDYDKRVMEGAEKAGYTGAAIVDCDNRVTFNNAYIVTRLTVSNRIDNVEWKLYGIEIIIKCIKTLLSLKMINNGGKGSHSLKHLYSILSLDLNRYFVLLNSKRLMPKIRLLLCTPGIWIIFCFRIGNYMQIKSKRYKLLKPIVALYNYIYFLFSLIVGISIPVESKIGGGLYIGHWGGIFIHPNAVIGQNCNISQGVTIGEGGREGNRGVPVIGAQVYIGPGAKLFGRITIGNNVAIGANAVVNRSVPDDAVVGGIPATVLNYKGSRDFVIVDRQSI